MPKTALVLNGCGAKGAFQVMAEKYAREVKGYTWDIIAGVSVGALNGVMLAMEKYRRLEAIWHDLPKQKFFSRRPGIWTFTKLLFGGKSIFGNKTLKRLIDREVEPEKIKVPLRIWSVSLHSGQSICFAPSDPYFKKAIVASASVPIVWPPVDLTPDLRCMVDGAVRNISPFGDVLDYRPDDLLIIDCHPPQPPEMECPARNVLDIGRRAIEIAAHEIFFTDCTEFMRINMVVQQASAKGITLCNEKGKPFKQYEYKVIAPDEPLGDSLDFSRRTIEHAMEAGWEKAKQVLE